MGPRWFFIKAYLTAIAVAATITAVKAGWIANENRKTYEAVSRPRPRL